MKQRYDDEIEFTVTCRMKPRWVPHFLAMLKYMCYLGNVGSSRHVTFMADGDGDFRPQFEWEENLQDNAEPIEDHDGDRLYDAG